MLGRDEVEAIFKTALAASRADDLEVVLGGGRLNLVRLDEGAVRENRSETWYELRVRAFSRGAVGVARTGRLDPEGVRAAVARALEAAKAAPPQGILPPPGPESFPEPTRYDPAVAGMPPAARLGVVAPLLLEARRHGARASGTFVARGGSIGAGGTPGLLAIANSRGLFAYHRRTRLRLDARVLAGEGSGWAEAEGWLARSFDPAPAISRALAKALAARVRRALPPGEYDAVLEPAALATFLRTLAPHFSARAVEEGWSFVTGREGRSVARGNVTLLDDYTHPLHDGIPFDGEGVPRRRLPLIIRGIVRGLATSREMARRLGVPPTGHAPLQPADGDAIPQHLVMLGEDRSVEDLIASVERGILVTRLWRHRVLRPERALCTGLSRDGTYWIEKGKVRHALADLRYEMSAFDILAYATLLSRPERALGVVAPAVKVRRFRIVG